MPTTRSSLNIASQVQALRSRAPQILTVAASTAEALTRVENSIHGIEKTLRVLTDPSLLTPLYVAVTLTANANFGSPAPPDGNLLTVLLLQDSTGHWTVTFDGVFGSVPDLGPGDPNTYSTLQFVGVGVRWYLASIIVGQPL